ncbi:MAG: hypothetical protein LBP76_13620 [Treponema sp.]|nr:hypothetical protein [Treponema sp.]
MGLCVAAAQEVAVFPQLGHTGGVFSATFSPDGRRIVSTLGDGTVKIWNADTGWELRTLSGHSSSSLLYFITRPVDFGIMRPCFRIFCVLESWYFRP